MFLWMMGYLTALGITLKIADGAYLMDTCPTYSYEDNGRAYLDAMKSAVKDQYTELDHNIRAMSEQRAYVTDLLKQRGFKQPTQAQIDASLATALK